MEARSLAIVTPSFRGDFERCVLLAESLGHCAPDFTHYIIVDSNDLSLFRALSSNRTVIVDSREVLDPWLHRLPGNSGIWWSVRTPPVRGWITQQIRKLAVDRVCSEDIFLCCDSDTVFLRKFSLKNFVEGGKFGLLDVDFCDDYVKQWTHTARALIGLRPGAGAFRGHVGMMILWERSVLTALQDHIAQNTDMPWQQAIARQRTFSEYITYGVFVRELLGYGNSPHAPSTTELVKTNWGKQLDSDEKLAAFFSDLKPENLAAMVHSKDGIDPRSYRTHVEACWKAA